MPHKIRTIATANVSYAVLLSALFISGISGLINQIAWQRAVKIYLGNSETLSATIVVLVFMLGLGAGSFYAAKRSRNLTNPFLALGSVEILLFVVNCLLIFAFGEALRSYGYALMVAGVNAGIPASALFALLSFCVLIVPCFLMGLTIPFAAEAAQRQLAVSRNKAVSHFFFVNTVGAVLGTLGCGLLLMPIFGQKIALAFAAGGNLIAGVIVLVMLAPMPTAVSQVSNEGIQGSPAPSGSRQIVSDELLLAFVLGALSLSYEIYLFRIMALAYTPLPWIFCVVLCGFLLFWSVGVAASEWGNHKISTALVLTAISIAVVPFILAYQRFHATSFPIWSVGLIYFLPCFGFGMLFGIAISRYSKSWGRDVGVFTALNTSGSGVGILVTTFLLFELDKDVLAWILGAGLLLFVPRFYAKEHGGLTNHRAWNYLAGAACLALLVFAVPRAGPVWAGQRAEFYGRDGVVEVAHDGRVYIDGLWHSVLYRDNDHAARKDANVRRKILIGVLPFLAHSGHGPLDVLNIGMGTGATARTLAKSPSVESVDAYEIVTTVREVIDSYPQETLGTTDLDKITVHWEDARAGMVRRDRKYDIITQSPLYLKQSGSSLLLSREYFQLLKSRLKPGGIAGIYSNSQGNKDQALLVRKTVSEVFEHYVSFGNGYFILASDRPIRIDRENFQAKMISGDPIVQEVIALGGIDEILKRFDHRRLDWKSSPYVITDDHPLVEHPQITSWLHQRAR